MLWMIWNFFSASWSLEKSGYSWEVSVKVFLSLFCLYTPSQPPSLPPLALTGTLGWGQTQRQTLYHLRLWAQHPTLNPSSAPYAKFLEPRFPTHTLGMLTLGIVSSSKWGGLLSALSQPHNWSISPTAFPIFPGRSLSDLLWVQLLPSQRNGA